MDDTAQNGQSNDKIVSGQAQYAPTASSLNKETGLSAFSEVVRPSQEEIKVGEELTSVGIVATNIDKPKLDKIHEQIGVKASLESTPIDVKPKGTVILPMTEEEADQALRMKQSKFNLHENVGEFAGEYTEDSLPFFAALVKKIFKEMHKRVFGQKPK